MGSTQPSRDTRSPPGTGPFGASANNAPFPSRYNTSPSAERRSFDANSPPQQSNQSFRDGVASTLPTLLLRRLPTGMNQEALYSMLLFAEDFQTARFIEATDEQGFQSAAAEFRSLEGAREARSRLHGKQNVTNGARMIVDLLTTGAAAQPSTASTEVAVEGLGIRRQLSNAASRGSSTNGPRQSSRYFQSMGEKINSITIPPPQADGEETHVFSPRSPRGSAFRDNVRQTGKSMISEDADDETGELLKDPVAYAKSNRPGMGVRRSNSAAQAPVSRMAGLSLNTTQNHHTPNNTMMSPTGGGLSRNMSQQPISPAAELPNPLMSNGMTPMSPGGSGYPISPTQVTQRHLPPANPADQNPPCNTLYVGNLPIDTSEDELKAIFSKQRGYKRLCFRTKHNGPMCFVEFEDVSFATKALNELYGHTLHNSVKGGIRLSFSKNPLGVRTGQANSLNPGSPLGSPGSVSGFGGPGAFSGVSGPPPGLGMPLGLNSPPMSAGGQAQLHAPNGGYSHYFGPSSPPLSSATGPGVGRYNGYMGAGGLGHIGTGS